MKEPAQSANDASAGEDLCNACGLCCNGVIFADVQLRARDDAARLRALGLLIKSSGVADRKARFLQPCAAHEGCRCAIYSERPEYCREFDCALLKRFKAGRTVKPAALRIIQLALDRAGRVAHLLRKLGDTEETLALGARFRRTVRRLEQVAQDEATAASFAQLTLAMHSLNRLLAEEFYPGRPAQSP